MRKTVGVNRERGRGKRMVLLSYPPLPFVWELRQEGEREITHLTVIEIGFRLDEVIVGCRLGVVDSKPIQRLFLT